MAATAHVLNGVPELLENILLQLDTKDLLFAQHTSKYWQSTVASSPKLQQVLWLKPTSDVLVSILDRVDPQVEELVRSGLSEDEARLRLRKSRFPQTHWSTGSSAVTYTVVPNPLFGRVMERKESDSPLLVVFRNSAAGRPGSWKEMFATSPRLSELTLAIYRIERGEYDRTRDHPGDSLLDVDVRNPLGITLGNIVDELLALKRKVQAVEFIMCGCSQWKGMRRTSRFQQN